MAQSALSERPLAGRTPGAGRRRTIAIVTPAYEHVGGLRTVAEFIRTSIGRYSDFEVRMVSLATSWRDPCNLLLTRPSTWRDGVRAERRSDCGQSYIHVGAPFGEFEFGRYGPNQRLRSVLAGCDLVQVVAGSPAWAWPAIGLGKPVALQVATLTAVERQRRQRDERGPHALWRRAMTGIACRADRAALKAVDAIVVENPWMLEHVEAVAARRALVRYGPPGVDTSRFHPAPIAEKRRARPYILAVGRFADPRKNVTLLLDAYARVVEAMEEAPDLVLAGATNPTADFDTRLQALNLGDRVTLVRNPAPEALARLYRHALCLALPSDEEGFGMVVIEAMASGAPVVATRCGGPDGVITDGLDGFLVNRSDAFAFADRLVRLAESPVLARAMGVMARRTIEDRYAEPVAAKTYLDLYETLLGGASNQAGD